MEDKISLINYKPKNRWMDAASMRPGSVGSVGDVLMMTRFKHSSMELPQRYDPMTAHKRESRVGSYVQDGWKSNYRGAGGARTFHEAFVNSDFFNTRGYRKQDVGTPDKLVTPVDLPTPGYSWQNKVAQNFESKRTGDKFLPMPGEYALPPGQVPRGPMPVSSPIVDGADSGTPSYMSANTGIGGGSGPRVPEWKDYQNLANRGLGKR
jgi:hypothetical protein